MTSCKSAPRIITILVWVSILAVACSSPLPSAQFTRILDVAPVTEPGYWFGVCWVDYDNDQLPDLFLTQWWSTGTHYNALYHNDGDGAFSKITDQAPSQGANSLGATWGDYDNDGDEDAFVTRPGIPTGDPLNYLYRNDGSGTFTAITTGPVVTDRGRSVHPVWGDLDNDGDLDLIVGNHNLTGGLFYYRNDGGNFVRLSNTSTGLDTDDCGAVNLADTDGDGDLDFLHARNMLTSRFYVNQGTGIFAHASNAISTDNTRAYACGDYDNDGDLDLCGGEDWSQGLILYRNSGGGVFERVIIDPSDVTSDISRKPYWVDYDNDGNLDLFVAKQGAMYAPAKSALYRNVGDGSLSKVSGSGLEVDALSSSGSAWADYDRDGDLDLFVANTNNTLNALYRNDNGSGNNWINIKCIGTVGNRSAIGAKIRVKATIGGTETWQLREISSQSGFFGQDEMRAHFGLGTAAVIDSIIVEWPGQSAKDVLVDVAVCQFLTIVQTAWGDANGDAAVNISDAVYLIAYIFAGGAAPSPLLSGDANCDRAINISDAVYLIAYIFSHGPAPSESCG